MAMKRKVKAPKARWGQGGKAGKMASSTKKSKPKGLGPGTAFYGIKNTSKGGLKKSVKGVTTRVSKGQKSLKRKAKRQVG